MLFQTITEKGINFKSVFVFNFSIQTNNKVGLSPSKRVGFIYFNEFPFELTKNAFYLFYVIFILEEIFKLLS